METTCFVCRLLRAYPWDLLSRQCLHDADPGGGMNSNASQSEMAHHCRIPPLSQAQLFSQDVNDVQSSVDCAMPNDIIIFNMTTVEAASTIVISKPLLLRGQDGSVVDFSCPSGGTVFKYTVSGPFP